MPWLDRNETYGWLSIGLHWLVAGGVFGLFFLGHYMVDLTYYDRWYNKAPAIHKAIGMIGTGAAIGGATAPAMFGWVMDIGEPQWIFYVVGICFALTTVVILTPMRKIVARG